MPRCYTLPCDFLRIKRFLKELVLYAMLRFAYNSILKGTRRATNCLKMHFVSIFAASAEVFIRCAVILLTRIFILRIIQFIKELDVQRAAKKSSSFPFCGICRSFYTLRRDFAPCFFNQRIKIVLKGTRQSKIIRCAVILLPRIFILRIIQFSKELDVQRTA